MERGGAEGPGARHSGEPGPRGLLPWGRRGGARRGFISSSASVARSEPESCERHASPPAPMQPHRRPLPAPAPGDPRPTSPLVALPLLLLLLALQGATAAPAGSGGAEDSGWRQDAALPRGLLQQAARVALHFFNFRAGSPSALRVLAAVQEGRAWVSAGAAAAAGSELVPARPRSARGRRASLRKSAGDGLVLCGICKAVDFSQGSCHTWGRGAWAN